MSDSEMLTFKLAGRPNKNEQHSGDLDENGLEIFYYNAETLHGMHYTEEEFEAEVLNRYQNFCSDFPAQAQDAEFKSFLYNTFLDWNDNNVQRADEFMSLRDRKERGFVNITNESEMPTDENWQPINGISLMDYAQAIYVSNKYLETTDAQLAEALGVELPIYDETKKLWVERLDDENIFNAYLNFQQLPIENEGLKKLIPEGSVAENDEVERFLNDDHFYFEINGLLMAAQAFGMDGMQYIHEKFNISAVDYSAGSQNSANRNNGNTPNEYLDIMMSSCEHYSKLFSEQLGGNVADGVDF